MVVFIYKIYNIYINDYFNLGIGSFIVMDVVLLTLNPLTLSMQVLYLEY